MGRAWDHSANHRSSVNNAASAAVLASSMGSKRDGPRSKQMGSEKRCSAIHSGLKPMRVPHMARMVDDDRAGEKQDASDFLRCNR